MSGHGFGHNRHLFHILMPVFRGTEHFRRMDITDYVVDIPVIYDYLGDSGFYEAAFQLVQRGSQIDSHHFGTGNDAVADFYVREVEGVLEDFHFRVQLFFIFGIINAALYEIVQVDFSKSSVGRILINLHSKEAKENTRQAGG